MVQLCLVTGYINRDNCEYIWVDLIHNKKLADLRDFSNSYMFNYLSCRNSIH